MPMSASKLLLGLDDDFQYGILCVIDAGGWTAQWFWAIAHPAWKEHGVLRCGVESRRREKHTQNIRGRKLREEEEWTLDRRLRPRGARCTKHCLARLQVYPEGREEVRTSEPHHRPDILGFLLL